MTLVHSALYTVHYTVHSTSLHSTIHSAPYTALNIPSTSHNTTYTAHNTPYTVHPVQHTVTTRPPRVLSSPSCCTTAVQFGWKLARSGGGLRPVQSFSTTGSSSPSSCSSWRPAPAGRTASAGWPTQTTCLLFLYN